MRFAKLEGFFLSGFNISKIGTFSIGVALLRTYVVRYVLSLLR